MSFAPLERRTAVDDCAQAMREAILSGRLSPGDQLPPERKLAESFGVNRVTVRGALARLAQAQLVTVRQGSGYRVRDFRSAGGPDLLPGLLDVVTDAQELREVVTDLLHMRRALAQAVLQKLMALEKVPTEGIAAAIDAMERAAQQRASVQALAQADLAVLGAIVDATGSAVLRLCMNPVTQVLSAMPQLCAAMYDQPLSNVAGYRALLSWCEQPSTEGMQTIIDLLAQRDLTTLSLFPTQEPR